MIYEQLLLIGAAIILLPPLLEKLHMDVRAGEVLTGLLLVYLMPSTVQEGWIASLANVGLLVLMFEIGLDIDIDGVKEHMDTALKYAALSFGLPFIAVLGAVYYVLGDMMTALLFGIGLSSTALAVVSPLMRDRGIEAPIVKAATMFAEMIGITLLVALVPGSHGSSVPLVTQVLAVFGFIAFAIFVLPELVERLQMLDSETAIDFEMKFVLFIVVAMALVSERLGIHAATGAFMAGLFFAESTHRGEDLEARLKPVVELLVPVFFFHLGTRMSPGLITPTLIGAAIGLGALVHGIRLVGFQAVCHRLGLPFRIEEVNLFAPCITITATAASIGMDIGVLSAPAFNTFLLAGLVLTILGPMLFRLLE